MLARARRRRQSDEKHGRCCESKSSFCFPDSGAAAFGESDAEAGGGWGVSRGRQPSGHRHQLQHAADAVRSSVPWSPAVSAPTAVRGTTRPTCARASEPPRARACARRCERATARGVAGRTRWRRKRVMWSSSPARMPTQGPTWYSHCPGRTCVGNFGELMGSRCCFYGGMSQEWGRVRGGRANAKEGERY